MYKIKNSQMYGTETIVIIRENDDGSVTSFGEYEGNTDYQEYLKWLNEGNIPLPADTATTTE